MKKIALFYKSLFTKAFGLLFVLTLVLGSPKSANADILSAIFGSSATAESNSTQEEVSKTHNSQTIPLLETSINPDSKNAEEESLVIVQDDSFIYNHGMSFASESFEKSSISDKMYVYTVKKGDTLSEIAELFDVSVNTIRWENNISGQSISVGQKLNILPVTGVRHTVKSGDTVSKIADKYEAEAEDIFVFNDISKDSKLKQGDILFVPNGVINQVVTKSSPSKASSGSRVVNVKVQGGYYVRPVSGIITSPYGARKSGYHYGVDIGNKIGTPVVAAASGVVTKVVSGCREGVVSCGGRYGNYIVIEHSNGTKTIYAHLNTVDVSVGDNVSQGEKIGGLGNTGRSSGPHLHFEIENASGSKMRPPF